MTQITKKCVCIVGGWAVLGLAALAAEGARAHAQARSAAAPAATATTAAPAADAPAAGSLTPAKQVGRLNHEALDYFDLLEFELARSKLLEAVKLAHESGLDEDRILARTYLHLGAVYIAGYKDAKEGVAALRKALRIDPTVELTPAIVNREVRKQYDKARSDNAAERAAVETKIAQMAKQIAAARAAEKARIERERSPEAIAERARLAAAEEAKRQAKQQADEKARKAGDEHVAAARLRAAGVDPSKPNETTAPAVPADPKTDTSAEADAEPAEQTALRCPPAADMPARRPLALRCAVDQAVDAAAVFVFYRPVGREEFTPQLMRRSPQGFWEATIAPELMVSPGVEIYFEARSKKGKPLASDGSAGRPKTFSVGKA